jgi:hypothetical protein
MEGPKETTMNVRVWRLAVGGLAGSLAGVAAAQPQPWAVTVLHPGPARAFGVGDGWQVGVVEDGFNTRAALWRGSAASYVDLHSGEGSTIAYGVGAAQQVGEHNSGGSAPRFQAVFWTGSAASLVSLHPAGSRDSTAFAVENGQQVGSALFISGDGRHAGLWEGTAESWIDLHPAGANWSVALGVHAGRQTGHVRFGEVIHAGLWSGSAASWVDLHPAGATESHATGIHGDQQVGNALVDGAWHAGVWTGDAASWVDLHPGGAAWSYAEGIHSGYQAGYVTIGGVARASVWNGTAESWEDLSTFFPGSWTRSAAHGIWSDGETLYVVGSGDNRAGQEEALLWTRPVDVRCYADCDESGGLDLFDFLCFQNLFAAGGPEADCDGSGELDFFDFLCFQNAFAAGCP